MSRSSRPSSGTRTRDGSERNDTCSGACTRTFISYLSQEGPKAPKHAAWKHPILCFITHYTLATIAVFIAHDHFFRYIATWNVNVDVDVDVDGDANEIPNVHIMTMMKEQEQRCIGIIFLGYWFCLILYRLANFSHDRILQIAVLYESTFLCNMTLYMTGIVLLLQSYDTRSTIHDHSHDHDHDRSITTTHNRELIILAHLVTVSIDQVLWYVDLAGWVATRGATFPIGVAKYLTWPNTSWTTRITSTHHLWTIPLAMYACRDRHGDHDHDHDRHDHRRGYHNAAVAAYFLSAFVMVVNVLLSRWMTPSAIEYRDDVNGDRDRDHGGGSGSKNGRANANDSDSDKDTVERKIHSKYLNVNLSHELWKDITFSFLQIQHDDPPVGVYLFRLFWRWQALNGIVYFGILRPLSRFFLG